MPLRNIEDDAETHPELRQIQSNRIEVHDRERPSWAAYFPIHGAPWDSGRRGVHSSGWKGYLFGSEVDENIIGVQRGSEYHLNN